MTDLFMDRGAEFSACKTYRFRLWRIWDASRPPLVMVMLNPSKADVDFNDPTVERCTRRAMALKCGGIVVANIFALVSTDPKALYPCPDPVGHGNDEAILRAVGGGGLVLCGWGKHGNHLGRGAQVLTMLESNGVTPYCLDQNEDGTPTHPLYLPYSLKPRPYRHVT